MSEVLVLKKRKDFVRVASKGEKMVASTLILQAAPSLSAPENAVRVGYTTTRKLGKAHIRNRTRRRLRAAVREIFPQYAAAGTDYVLIGRYNTADCPFEKLKNDLLWTTKKINKLFNKNGNGDEEPARPLSDSAG